jgi:KinB signaling pathway activation protein
MSKTPGEYEGVHGFLAGTLVKWIRTETGKSKIRPERTDLTYGRGNGYLSLRKWMKLFGATILIGGLATLIIGVCMQLSDPQFRNIQVDGWLYNLFQMAMIGFTFGAFAHMGFFAYLMLNYIARSIFKRPYLWVALQGFITVFVLIEIAYWTYGTNFPNATFWAVPLALVAGSLAVSWRKVHETTPGAWVPTLFFLVAVTVLEGMPAFRTASMSSLVFQLVPLFICNTYQIMRLHRILEGRIAVPAGVKAG